jgi:hypothetical protein
MTQCSHPRTNSPRPFFNALEPKVQELVGAGDAEATMAKLREMKNNF